MTADFTDRVTVCAHRSVRPTGNGWARCDECGDNTFPISDEAAGRHPCCGSYGDCECESAAALGALRGLCDACHEPIDDHDPFGGCPVLPPASLALGTIVLVTLRWTEREGKRTREREQVRVGTVGRLIDVRDGRGVYVAVDVPGCKPRPVVPIADVQDVGCGRRVP
jgi:hypothetical protein